MSVARVMLLLGGNGTLGQAFQRLAAERGLPLVVLERQQSDVGSAAEAQRILLEYGPWAVINAAGWVRVREAERHAALCHEANVRLPAVWARAASEAGIPLLTFSSDLVFSGAGRVSRRESDYPLPLCVYGRSKMLAERRVLAAHSGALVIRSSAFFGPWDEANFVHQVSQRLRAGEVVRASTTSMLAPTYVPDLVHAALDLLIDGERGIWHLTNQGSASWAELAYASADIQGLPRSLVHPVPGPVLPSSEFWPQNSVLRSERGELLPSWQDALARWALARVAPAEEPAAVLKSA